ncbi:MAG: hypothetical protein P8168_05090 [Deltaproteobacteria bacterium]
MHRAKPDEGPVKRRMASKITSCCRRQYRSCRQGKPMTTAASTPASARAATISSGATSLDLGES